MDRRCIGRRAGVDGEMTPSKKRGEKEGLKWRWSLSELNKRASGLTGLETPRRKVEEKFEEKKRGNCPEIS